MYDKRRLFGLRKLYCRTFGCRLSAKQPECINLPTVIIDQMIYRSIFNAKSVFPSIKADHVAWINLLKLFGGFHVQKIISPIQVNAYNDAVKCRRYFDNIILDNVHT